ncbi:unnamed protein product [Phytophthora fragariaefolia]|uniref:Unnamed protein product n=1 Tax=Phytophthora fragariaefolia TaxID=1490495 RepID=A0A9W6YD27_9STRA|nr:unnamed protein product [Phytophthora fragariaefolia]
MLLRATDDTSDPREPPWANQSKTLGTPGASLGHPDLASEATQRSEMASNRVASGRSTEEFSAESTGPPPRKSPSQWEPTSATPAGRTHRVPPPTQTEERPGTEVPLQPRRVEHHDQAAPTSFRHQLTSGVELSESAAPLSRPRPTEVGGEEAEEAELSGGDVEPTAESSGSVEDSAVAGVGDLAEADSAPAREALGGVSEVEAWPPDWSELGGELVPAVSAADDANGSAVVGETAGAVSAGGEPLVETA